MHICRYASAPSSVAAAASSTSTSNILCLFKYIKQGFKLHFLKMKN